MYTSFAVPHFGDEGDNKDTERHAAPLRGRTSGECVQIRQEDVQWRAHQESSRLDDLKQRSCYPMFGACRPRHACTCRAQINQNAPRYPTVVTNMWPGTPTCCSCTILHKALVRTLSTQADGRSSHRWSK